MASIDERVVSLKFDNAQFAAGVKKTISDLTALNKGLKLDGAAKGLGAVSNAANRLNFRPLSSAVDSVRARFSAMQAIALGALASIGAKAVSVGSQLIKSLTVDPIMDGLREYEINLNSIQTILSNTQKEGTSLDDVNRALQELNLYSDLTIYNFAEMARNIGTFTAAGVKLDTSVAAIKGIANLAAVSGSTSHQAATAMYQLSQALAAGRVSLMDWNSVVNAGMGGQVFQDSLMETARVHGIAIDDMVEDAGSFRESLSDGWLSSEILTETLNKFTGDLSEAQLLQMGYTEEQIAGIIKMGQTATDAATKIKTFSQLMATLQETAASGWALTWQYIFGDFDQAKEMFTGVNDVLSGFINASNEARNEILGDWNELGGRTVLIEAIGNAFNALLSIIRPISAAFRDIFPATTGQQLYDLTVSLRNFTESLILSDETAGKLQRSFAGFFAVLDILRMIVVEAVKVLLSLFGAATEGSGSFLDVTARIGDFLVGVRDAIKEGKVLETFFRGLGAIIAVPIAIIGAAARVIRSLFDGVPGVDAGGAVGAGIERIADRLRPMEGLAKRVRQIWEGLLNVLGDVWRFFQPMADRFYEFFQDFGRVISDSFADINYSTVLDTVNTGLFAGLVLAVNRFLKGGLNFNLGNSNFLGSITGPFDALTDTLSAMQANLKASTLIKIAGAVALLTASVVALSLINSGDLTKSLTAITAMFVQLTAAMFVLENLGTIMGAIRMKFIVGSLITLGIAIAILSISVTTLSNLAWDELVRGLTGLAGVLVILAGAIKLMSGSTAGLTSAGIGLVLLATSVAILATAVEDLGEMNWKEIGRGLVAMGAILGGLALFTQLAKLNKTGPLTGIGLVLIAAGVRIMADALGKLGDLSWGEIARGLTAMAGGLVVLAGALAVLPPSSVLSAAAIFVATQALGGIADALEQMGDMSWDSIGKSLTLMAGALAITAGALLLMTGAMAGTAALIVVAASLAIIAPVLERFGEMGWVEIGKAMVVLTGALLLFAGGMYLMTGALPGALALIVAAGALRILTPALIAMAGLSWGEIARGLTLLAGAMTIFGIGGMLLTAAMPGLIGLGIAVALLGVATLAAGVGVLAFAVALTTLAAAGAAGTLAIVGIVSGLLSLIPQVARAIGEGVVQFAIVIATAGPQILRAISTVIAAFIGAIVENTPKAALALVKMLLKLLQIMNQYAPRISDAGATLIVKLLDGLRRNMPRMSAAGTNVIIAFLREIAKQGPRITDAGVKTIISLVNGLANAIRSNQGQMRAAGRNLAMAIIDGMTGGLASGTQRLASRAAEVARSALNAAKRALGIRSPSREFFELGKYSDEGLAQGLLFHAKVAEDAGKKVGVGTISAVRESLNSLRSAVDSDMEISPRISPVLDLRDVRKNALALSKMFEQRQLATDATYVTAKRAVTGYKYNRDTAEENAELVAAGGPSFVQNNYSPKALPSGEIYRNTKSLLAKAKGADT